MTGLLLALVLGCWAWLCLLLARRASRAVTRTALRRGVRYLLFIGLLPLPLADEILSRGAFTHLCESRGRLEVFDGQLAGKTIWFTGVRSQPLRIGLLSGLEKDWTYAVADSGAPAFRYSSIHVKGGWLMRMLGISETTSPLLLAGECNPVDTAALPRRLGVRIVDKPVP